MCYEFSFFFDWGSGTCLWSTNDKAVEKYDYPVDINQLPISASLKEQLMLMTDTHDEALDWDNPAGELLWDNEQMEQFISDAVELYHQLCQELGHEYKIELKRDLLI